LPVVEDTRPDNLPQQRRTGGARGGARHGHVSKNVRVKFGARQQMKQGQSRERESEVWCLGRPCETHVVSGGDHTCPENLSGVRQSHPTTNETRQQMKQSQSRENVRTSLVFGHPRSNGFCVIRTCISLTSRPCEAPGGRGVRGAEPPDNK
jgi:hypothetical protein